jgi:hypothetical protein
VAQASDDRGAVTRRDDVSIGDVVELVKSYAKQETLGPLKGAGRWLGAGVGGAILLGIGMSLIALGMLRLVQTELDNLARGGWSFTPYAIVFAFCALVVILALSRINKTSLDKERD